MDDYDFSGWATKNNIQCSDGRTIMKDAFKQNDGQKVPLVWNHQHNDPNEVLGHAMLENRNDGVYAYCKFNNTESGQTAKSLVVNGDVDQLSIYANKLKSESNKVIHGCIREVSLVLAGANPGAYIDSVVMHGDGSDAEEEVIIYTDEASIEINDEIEDDLEHSDDSENKEEQEMEDDDKTIADVFNSMTEEQKTVVYALIGQALEDNEAEKNNEEGEDEEMKHNVFDKENNEEVLAHSDIITGAIADAKKYGSMRESFIAHSEEAGIDNKAITNIENIGKLFPDATEINREPRMIEKDNSWVSNVMNKVTHSPFSRVKATFGRMSETEARAKGYIKGDKKTDIKMSILNRVTTPTTVYIKNEIDRDDVIDIVDLDVVAWQKREMRKLLDKELATAMLLGDGRPVSSRDKINEQNIRPVLTDDELFTIQYEVKEGRDYKITDNSYSENDAKMKGVVRASIKSRKDYKGSGKPTFYTTEDVLNDLLLIEDQNGRVIYDSEDKLKTAMRVNEIVTVPEMESHTDIYGIIVNMADYKAGADKGGSVSLFDDFDIDYNQMKYLMETRMSGALTVPYSAIVLRKSAVASEPAG